MVLKEVINYLKGNPIQLAILIACLAIVIVSAILLIVTKSKATNCPMPIDPAEDETAAAEEAADAEQPEPASKEAPQAEAAEKAAPIDMAEEANKPITEPIENAPTEQKEENETEQADKPIEADVTDVPKEKPQAKPKKELKKSAKGKGTNAAKSALAATKKMGEIAVPKEEKPSAPIPKIVSPFKKPSKQKPEPVRYAGKWVVCKLVLSDANNEVMEENYFFELRASNGELLLASEEYTTYAGAIKGIQTHKDNVKKGNFRIVLSKKGDYIFKLLTAKNTLLCTGANYKSLERCESAVASTKRFAETAVLQEETEELHIKLPPEEDSTEPEIPENGYTGKWIISTKGNEEVGTMYYFELFASNGEKLLTSEEYTTYEGAVNAVETHKTNIAKDNFRITITKRGDYLFKLLGGNGQLLCLGEHYKTRTRCENAVESVKRFSKSAPIYKYGEISQ